MVTTYKVQTQFGEDRCTQFRVIVVTDPQTGPITIHCAAASAQCNKVSYRKLTDRVRIRVTKLWRRKGAW